LAQALFSLISPLVAHRCLSSGNMLRVVLATSVVAASASRVNVEVGVHEQSASTVDQSIIKWGASCEFLQARFHDRVVAFQTAVEANPDENAISLGTQTRLSMRAFGVARTLRRARECEWVINNDSPDIGALQTIVQGLLAGNPCAEQASAALQEGDEEDLATVWRSMSMLMSDTCEVADFSDSVPVNEENADSMLESEMDDGEAQVQDRLEELESQDMAPSLLESNAGTVRGFFRGLGVAFGFILLLLLCTSAALIIGFFVPAILFLIAAAIFPALAPGCGPCMFGTAIPQAFGLGIAGAAVTGVVGLVQCARGVHSLLIG